MLDRTHAYPVSAVARAGTHSKASLHGLSSDAIPVVQRRGNHAYVEPLIRLGRSAVQSCPHERPCHSPDLSARRPSSQLNVGLVSRETVAFLARPAVWPQETGSAKVAILCVWQAICEDAHVCSSGSAIVADRPRCFMIPPAPSQSGVWAISWICACRTYTVCLCGSSILCQPTGVTKAYRLGQKLE